MLTDDVPDDQRSRLDALRGNHNPTTSTPPRTAGSIRRTTSIEMLRPEGIEGRLLLDASGRDLVTKSDGSAVVVDTAGVRAWVDFAGKRELIELALTPPYGDVRPLLGASVATGFRGLVSAALPDLRHDRSLQHLLVDDLPGAALVSGYAHGFASTTRKKGVPKPDLCAGWRVGGTMMLEVGRSGHTPMVVGPPAPRLEDPADPLGWHALSDVPPNGMRRRRRMDVRREGGVVQVDVLFRDSHADAAGNETVIHEYTVTATLDARSHIVTAISAVPHVLPWRECPFAAASATELAGKTVDDLRTYVRAEFVGASTCTHLNDTLRSFEDVPRLLDEYETAFPPDLR